MTNPTIPPSYGVAKQAFKSVAATSPFTPPPEMVEKINAEWRKQLGPVWRKISPAATDALASLAIAVLAPMIAEECAKVADAQCKDESCCGICAAAIRAKFTPQTAIPQSRNPGEGDEAYEWILLTPHAGTGGGK